jgi:16S rRNA (guanine527-N7)-methyltransferase
MPERGRPDPDPDALLDEGARRLGLALGPRERSAFRLYRDEILRWSQRVNLTALRDPARLVREGFLDSLACLLVLPAGTDRAVDLGSGAGFPALPLAIVRPDQRFTLVEASRRKANFLRHVCRLLELDTVEVLWCRAEALAEQPAHAGAYDLAMARAVAHPGRQAELALPFLRPGGCFLAQLGPSCSPRDLVASLPAGRLTVARELPLPEFLCQSGRQLVLLRRA